MPAAQPIGEVPSFSQVVSETLIKIEADEETQCSILAMIHAKQSGNGSTNTKLDEVKAKTIVNTLDKLVQALQNEEVRDCCLRMLSEVCRTNVILPESYIVRGIVKGKQHKSSTYTDIWMGKLKGKDIRIKVFRKHENEKQAKIQGAFYYHVIGWKHISHENVVPFLGVSDELPPFCFISPWMPNNILNYTKEHQDADRLVLLVDAACGLKYLHSKDIVHGGINPENILISEQGTACIGDFGITGIISDPLVTGEHGTTACQRGIVRYMAPEQVAPGMFGLENSNAVKATDVHSFAMTAYEVIIGSQPYPRVSGDGQLAMHIIGKSRPPRPTNEIAARWLPDAIWKVMESCWTLQPSSRLSIEEVYQALIAGKDGSTPKGDKLPKGRTPQDPQQTSDTEEPPTGDTPQGPLRSETKRPAKRRFWVLIFWGLVFCLGLPSSRPR
ncbi:kinase-like protein [Thelephora ganbajun]|uniref:Kinase-like protein n=1 Tax=Thelephora ganbajun TaxID=370292 RepID=A0ACB6ZBB9_THEGA|nr:kinase-like protein [Thelephora ganbajun]